MRKGVFLVFSLLTILTVYPGKAQITSVYRDADLYYHQGTSLFKEGHFGLARNAFMKAEDQLSGQFDERSILLRKKSALMAAKSALAGDFPDGEKRIIDFYHTYSPDPLTYDALAAIGHLKYDKRLYAEAIQFYEKIKTTSLPGDIADEIHFKKGYSHFMLKEFAASKSSFSPLMGQPTVYRDQVFYYMGMIHFFEQHYDKAVELFLAVDKNELYKDRIPYYVAQIYFAQEKLDEVIFYIPEQLKNKDVENIKELRHILGQAFFLQNDYENALPHLAYYEARSAKMRKEDFYQLAFTQYQLGLYEEAAKNFRELSILKSPLGQLSNHYLADCYLKLDNKEEARISFKNVTGYSNDIDLEQEALFNYGKLSAELGLDRAAIQSLLEIPENSRFYNEAQNVLGELFESSRDYNMVIKTIEGIPNPAPRIKEAYQRVCLEQGLQLISDGQRNEAKNSLLKSVKAPVNQEYSALSYFYLGDLMHQEGQYDQSISYLNRYFTLTMMVMDLPEPAAPHMARYIQGYNYLKKEEYYIALTEFQKGLKDIEDLNFKNSDDLRERRIFADIVSRMADCYFTANQYENASTYYAIASQIEFPGQDYALFQNSMIKGLQGKPYEKLIILEDLIKTIPGSSFVDDAFFQAGETQFALGNMREAEIAYAKILNLKGRSALITRALLKLGLIAYNKGDAVKAIDYYTAIFKNNPNRTEAQEALVALEEIYIRDLGQAEEFIAIVEKNTGYKLSDLERDSISYMAAQGRFDNGEYIEAINSYTRYIENYPNGLNRVKAIFNRAESHTILRNYNLALPDYEKIVSLGQNDYYVEAIYKAALITYNDLKAFDKAFNYYSLLEDVTDDRLLKYEAQVGALRSAFRSDNPAAILAMATKVIANELANKDDRALAYLWTGKVYYNQKSWDLALVNLNQVPGLVDNILTAEAKFLINDIHFQKEDFDTAEKLTTETIANSTSYPYWIAKNLILLADLFMIKEDYFNAKAAIEAVLENFPENEELTSEANDRLLKVIEEETRKSRIEQQSDTIKLDTTANNG